MKTNDILINEGSLRGNWTVDKIRGLDGRQRRVLKQNAERAGDQAVLQMIASVETKQPAAAKPQTDYTWIIQLINQATAHAYPDVDPLEYIVPKVVKALGVRDDQVVSVLDRAVRASRLAKSYHDYADQLASEMGT